jgi:hypothetical protein
MTCFEAVSPRSTMAMPRPPFGEAFEGKLPSNSRRLMGRD